MKGLGILALPDKLVADPLKVPGRPVETAIFFDIDGDVAVSGPRTGHAGCDHHNHVPPNLVVMGGVRELHVMDPAVNAIDDQANCRSRAVG
jgi:hypothetical protein